LTNVSSGSSSAFPQTQKDPFSEPAWTPGTLLGFVEIGASGGADTTPHATAEVVFGAGGGIQRAGAGTRIVFTELTLTSLTAGCDIASESNVINFVSDSIESESTSSIIFDLIAAIPQLLAACRERSCKSTN